jgi:hypothetical protein
MEIMPARRSTTGDGETEILRHNAREEAAWAAVE